jgi:hypothetical protein
MGADLVEGSSSRAPRTTRPRSRSRIARWRGSVATIYRRLYLRRKATAQRLRALAGHRPERRPVFLAGVHRSGTNMMIETLEWHPRTQVFREGDPHAFESFLMRPRPVIEGLIDRSPADRVVIKALHETEQLREFLQWRPGAQAIWMFRDWRDVVNSILARWPGHRNGVDRILQGVDTASWRGRGMREETRARLAAVYHPELDDAAVNTLFWIFRNQLLFDQGLDTDPRLCLIDYDALMRDPATQLTALATFLEVPPTRRLLRIASADKIRKKPPPAVPPAIAALADEMLDRLRDARSAAVHRPS